MQRNLSTHTVHEACLVGVKPLAFTMCMNLNFHKHILFDSVATEATQERQGRFIPNHICRTASALTFRKDS